MHDSVVSRDLLSPTQGTQLTDKTRTKSNIYQNIFNIYFKNIENFEILEVYEL